MSGVAFTLVLFFLQGDPYFDGAVFPSMEACQAQIAEMPKMLATFNESAENPNKVTHFSAGCTPFVKAPQGKAV
jgi:hypothetical protein